MSYSRIDDGALDHPKMLHAESLYPDVAWTLWTRALVYTNKHRLDGRVPAHALGLFLKSRKVRPEKVADALVAAGLWEREGDDYVFRNFREWNMTRQEREEAAQANRQKVRQHRERHAKDPRATPPEYGPSVPPSGSHATGNNLVTDGSPDPPVTGYNPVSNSSHGPDVTGYNPVSNPSHEPPETGYGPVSNSSPLARASTRARAPSTPLHSTPLSPTPHGVEREQAFEDSPDPTEAELFRAYSAGASAAVGYPFAATREDKNAAALSTVWGLYGYGKVEKPAFLRKLEENVTAYIRAAQERGQPAQFEANYAPYRYLAWLQACEAGSDPWPTRRPGSGPRLAHEEPLPRRTSGGRSPSSEPRLAPAAARLVGSVREIGR